MPYKTGICRISDNTHTNPRVNFPAVANVIFNGCNVSLDPSIDSLIDELREGVSEWVGEWVVIDDVTAWPPDYQWVKLILYAPWESE